MLFSKLFLNCNIVISISKKKLNLKVLGVKEKEETQGLILRLEENYIFSATGTS
jgi:hypothetical protein